MGESLAQIDAGGIGEACSHTRQGRTHHSKALPLLFVERVFGGVRACEMAHQKCDIEALHQKFVERQGVELFHRQAQPIDTRINMQGTGQGSAILPAECCPFSRFIYRD